MWFMSKKKKQVIYELENLVLSKNKYAAQDLNFNKIQTFFLLSS